MLTTSFPVAKNPMSGIFIHHLVSHFPGNIDVKMLIPCPSYHVEKEKNGEYSLRCFRYAPMPWQVLAHEPGGLPAVLRNRRKSLSLFPVFLFSMLISCLRLALRTDIIHANWALNGAVAGIAGWFINKPVVTTLRGTDVTRLESSLVDWALLWFCCATNKQMICVSRAIHVQMTTRFPGWAYKFVAIPNGIGNEFLNAERHYSVSSTLRMAGIGNLTEQKGMHIILEAVAIVKRRKNVRCSIIGDGPKREALDRKISSLGLSGIVEMKGYMPHHDIPAFLMNTDMFVLASFSEGRPNAMLEAMAAGVPVIASNIEGVREIISHGENGLLFEPGRPEQLAEQIEQLIREPKLRIALGRAGRESVEKHVLSWEDSAKAYAELYQGVLECAE